MRQPRGSRRAAAAASRFHVELVDCELRAAARVVTGCPPSIPAHTLMVEAEMDRWTRNTRRTTPVTKMLVRESALLPDDPLALVAVVTTAMDSRRLTGRQGWC